MEEMGMYSYDILEPDCYYLVQLEKDQPLSIIQVKVVSDYAMYVVVFNNEVRFQWVKKADQIFDIVELLSEETAQKWLDAFNNTEQSMFGGGLGGFNNEDEL